MQQKIVVFDVDETLGYFSKLGKIWKLIETKNQNQDTFDSLLDLFPEFIRPHMLTILKYLKRQKEDFICNQVMIYTNNQSSSEKWIQYIKIYFENKLKYPLFDKIINAFKINGKKVELGRTSHKKSYTDLITCAKLPVNTQICFVDDTYYPGMDVSNVVYVKVKQPYIYDLSNEIIMKRLKLKNKDALLFTYIEKDKKEFELDKIISKKIMLCLQNFLTKVI
jgi:hypothetical protein